MPLFEAEATHGFDPDRFARDHLENTWNGDRTALAQNYIPDFEFEGTTNRAFCGRQAYDTYISWIRAAG